MADSPETATLHGKLNGETAKIQWRELQNFFARGMVFQVAGNLDLVQVAAAIAQDDKGAVEAWLAAGQLARVSDEQAQDWWSRDPDLWAVVVAPWILVQEKLH